MPLINKGSIQIQLLLMTMINPHNHHIISCKQPKNTVRLDEVRSTIRNSQKLSFQLNSTISEHEIATTTTKKEEGY